MKSLQEIVDRMAVLEVSSEDFFGFQRNVLISYLPYTQAKPFLATDATVTEEEWLEYSSDYASYTPEDIVNDMGRYMEFALTKVHDHRGLSSSRSVSKMLAWLWLLEDEELMKFANNPTNYPQYGAPILKRICDKYHLPFPNEEWFTNMAHGKPCQKGCNEGCGD